MMNWAEFEEEEKPAERCFWREVACALLIGAALAVIFGPLVGCATEPKEASKSPRQDICMVQALGQTDSGMPVVALHCITPEEFAAAQK